MPHYYVTITVARELIKNTDDIARDSIKVTDDHDSQYLDHFAITPGAHTAEELKVLVSDVMVITIYVPSNYNVRLVTELLYPIAFVLREGAQITIPADYVMPSGVVTLQPYGNGDNAINLQDVIVYESGSTIVCEDSRLVTKDGRSVVNNDDQETDASNTYTEHQEGANVSGSYDGADDESASDGADLYNTYLLGDSESDDGF